MKRAAVVMAVVMSGLCLLPACFPHDYIIVQTEKNIKDAREYCRNKYTDLAVVQSKEHLDKLMKLTGLNSFWIGLNRDTDAWTWSLEDETYYGEGDTKFPMWEDGYPIDHTNYKSCVMMAQNGKWKDDLCGNIHNFICYKNSTEGTSETSPSFIRVNTLMTWDAARAYCRNNYIDLASVRNQTENDQIKNMASNSWIGFYRNSWRWSDGSEDVFDNWLPETPSSDLDASCVAIYTGKWANSRCINTRPFVCYNRRTEMKVVKVGLKKAGPSVDMEELGEEILNMVRIPKYQAQTGRLIPERP
ncbi:putative C-type lectin domain family 20 member A [Mugil cephalus]|uniref:putative C-type lectin domain family 20 member A n=1 Tax=Mugil cephalus TaxID=48193 RepID=UPI001FB78A37|nr:putative C-type lectin domain family 20 member A [Mugil cephalus]